MRAKIIQKACEQGLLSRAQQLAHPLRPATGISLMVMCVQRIELVRNAAGRGDLRVVRARRHQTLSHVGAVEIVPFVPQ